MDNRGEDYVAKGSLLSCTEDGMLEDRVSGWQALLLRLQVNHKAKRRLMEVLDGLENNRKRVE